MLLDPLEEQFDLPARLVERTDGGSRQGKVVGQEDERLVGLGVFEADAAQMDRVVAAAVVTDQRDGLVAEDAGRSVGRRRIDTAQPRVRLGASDKEGVCQMHRMKSLEVQVATIHDVDRPGFRHQNVEHIDVVQLAVGNVDKGRDVAAQVEQRMHLHRRLGCAERGPWKHRQAQIDGRRIQRVSRVLQLEAKAVVVVELPSVRDQVLGEGRMNTPVSRLVRIGQRRALDFLAKPHVIKLGGLRRQADLDVAQAFAVSQLRKRHYAELLGAGHRLDVTIAVVAIDDAMKSLPGQKVHELGEQRLAEIHRRLRRKQSPKTASSAFRRSNRRHLKILRMPHQILVSSSWVSF